MNIEYNTHCPNCGQPNFIYSIYTLLQNKCYNCSTILDPTIEKLSFDEVIEKYIPEGVPEVIPENCGYCTYFKGSSWWSNKGHCNFYDEAIGKNYDCIITTIKKEIGTPSTETKKQKPICSNCKTKQDIQGALFCFKCGSDLYPKETKEVKVCSKCNTQYDLSYEYCNRDGNALSRQVVEVNGNTDHTNSTQTITKITESSEPKNQIDEKTNNELPMRWYSFITYLLFPVVVIGYILGALMINDDTVIVTFLVAAVFGAIIVYGLHNKTSWSWKFLILSYLLNSATFRIDRLEDVGLGVYIFGIIIINAIVTYPHYIYFNKRKHLFVN